MTESSSSPLQQLLSTCRELHNGTLSLRQLVPVHRSLCHCYSKTVIDSKAVDNPTTLDPILQLLSTEEQTTCQQLLTSTDPERLLAIQYLTHSLPSSEALRCVLLPYLLEERSFSEELVIALLDTIDMGDVADIDASSMSAILDTCSTSQQGMASRVLVRLVHASPSAPALVHALYEKIWQTLQAAASNESNTSLVASLSNDLLPLLTTKTKDGTYMLLTDVHRRHVTLLWSRLFSLYHTNTSELQVKQQQTLLLLTAVLCPLLPALVHQELPLVVLGSTDSSSTSKFPVEQPALWHVIFTSLSQGKSLLQEDVPACSLLRKRALYLLNLVAPADSPWKLYVMCVETLEMESEQHLVDQIWESVAQLLSIVGETTPASSDSAIPPLTWEWMSLLLARVLSADTPVIRKLGMYRLLKGHVGIQIIGDEDAATLSTTTKKQGKKNNRVDQPQRMAATMDIITPDFVLDVILPSWNTLYNSVGHVMHLETNRKVEKEDMIPLLLRFLQSHLKCLSTNEAQCREFWQGLWGSRLISQLHTKTIVLSYAAVSSKEVPYVIPATDDMLQSLASTIQTLFQNGSVVLTYRKELLQSLANMLAHCQSSTATSGKKWSPMTILQLLATFSPEHFALDSEEWQSAGDPLLDSLRMFTSQLDPDAMTVGAAVATAFVSGHILPFDGTWDPTAGATDAERDAGWAIPLMCTLAADASSQDPMKQTTGGELLWPAIHKGLSHAIGATLPGNKKADQVMRALLLLENGCKLRQLSGLGNGDLVVDKKTQQLMPPPPNIESMLSSGVSFIVHHIQTLVSIETTTSKGSGGTRSTGTRRTSAIFATLISQIRTLQQAFPSSMTVSSAMEDLLKSSIKALTDGTESDDQKVKYTALAYAAVSSGADPGAESYISNCRMLMQLELSNGGQEPKAWGQMARSVLQYAKWGSISCILPQLLESLEEASDAKLGELRKFLEDVFECAFDAVEATPADALLPLFKCVIAAAKRWLTIAKTPSEGEQFYVENLKKIIRALFALMKDCNISSYTMYMLNEICALIFHPQLLFDEYERLERDPDCFTPIRDAFRQLIEMAGINRPHITRAVLCRITIGWLGVEGADKGSMGLSAIPYREDIGKLLLHKEMKVDEGALNQSRREEVQGVFELPPETDDLSVTRGFVLVFLSKLPDINAGLNDKVLKSLLHHVILQLLKETSPKGVTQKSLIMKGTPFYCLKMRGWQALCNLTRFVTSEIAVEVCELVFKCMVEPIHGQIRYFIEIFTIQCATQHSNVFGEAFLADIARTDLTLQHVSSLMVIGGNWIVGRYKIDFFNPESGDDLRIRKALAAVIPWLSSTQGFSRAIAQLLVHAFIPLISDVKNNETSSEGDSDWFLHRMFNFLDNNREMSRLRAKQAKFFEGYAVEDMCTPEGVLSIAIDEGNEADPLHMVEAIKETLIEVYQETHGDDSPAWKQVENMLQAKEGELVASAEDLSEVNFQRKIIPLDALNLAMEDMRERKLRNIAGRKRQQLIVCASLVDKVPNLGGLARTAEIFAADRLIIPDLNVCKMDNFKSISVGAGDWIEMEECREEVRNIQSIEALYIFMVPKCC
jgi:hypothetical protein